MKIHFLFASSLTLLLLSCSDTNNDAKEEPPKKYSFNKIMPLSYSWKAESKRKSNSDTYANMDVAYSVSSNATSNEEDVSSTNMGTHERKLMKEGRVRFEVKDLNEEHAKIEQLIAKYDGYISSENSNTNEGQNEHSLTLRVPSIHFDKIFHGVGSDAVKMENKSIEIADVTEEHIDVSARIKTNIELENRFKDLLKKANKISEILSIESEIANLRAQIESEQGRLNYLNDRVSLSTIYVAYHLEKNYKPEPGYSGKLGSGLGSGWNKILNFSLFIVENWPIMILLFFGGRFAYRRLKRMKKTSTPKPKVETK